MVTYIISALEDISKYFRSSYRRNDKRYDPVSPLDVLTNLSELITDTEGNVVRI